MTRRPLETVHPDVGCASLLKTATPELFRVNAFRITGLSVDATPREIAKHIDKLTLLEDLGEGRSFHTGAFSLKTPPTIDQIRDAGQRLKDPEQRIIDEFFWFWPRQFGESTFDPAIKALENGDADTALEIWTALETSPADGLTAMHNVAILWHLMALEWESYYSKTADFTKEQRNETEKLWLGAFKRWNLLVGDDLLWERVMERIKRLDDPRMNSGFARRMRAALPDALDKINAELALRYGESGQTDLAKLHVRFMHETSEGAGNFENTVAVTLAPTVNRIKQHIQYARQRGASNPADGIVAANELLGQGRNSLSLFTLFSGTESIARNEISDEIAVACNYLQILYQKANGNIPKCLEVLKEALLFATSAGLKTLLQENVATLNRTLANKTLEPVYLLLKSIQESTERPSSRLARFRQDAVSVLQITFPAIPAQSDIYAELFDSAAIVLRGISLDAWNTHTDMTTAIVANEIATKYALDPDLRKRLSSDKSTLVGIRERRATEELARQQASNRNTTGCLIMLGIIGSIALVSSIHPNTTSSSTAPYTGSSANSASYAPSSTFTLPSSPAAPQTYHAPPIIDINRRNTYSAPINHSVELNQDKIAIENEKTKAAELERLLGDADRLVEYEKDRARRLQTLLDAQNAQINVSRTYLDQTNVGSVQQFNQQVDQYNAAVRDARAQNILHNRAVTGYNTLLEQVQAQNRTVNNLIDHYNAKLHRYEQ